MVILAATSPLFRSLVSCSSCLLLPCTSSSGQRLLDLLYKGKTMVEGQRERGEVVELMQLLDIKMELVMEDLESKEIVTCESLADVGVTSVEETTIELLELNDRETNVNEIIMANMNQNDNNVILNEVVSEFVSKPQKSPKDKNNKKIYICDFHPCVIEKLSFEGISKFKRHTHSAHNAKPLACPENKNGCTFRADDFSKLGNHVQGVHKNIYSENIVCEECHKCFPSQNYLKTHMQRMHRLGVAERGKICPYCGETKLQLNDHIMRSHRTQSFQCEYCPKKFKTSVQRRIHHNVHTGFRPYTCLTCEVRFSRLHHRKVRVLSTTHFGTTPVPPAECRCTSCLLIPASCRCT